MFRPSFLCEDTLGVAEDENHAIFRWSEARIFFSCCMKGDALSAHFSSDREGLRVIREAIEEFCSWVFGCMPWCKMIFACIVLPSVSRLVMKCGFNFLESREGVQVYVRYRKWEAY